MRRFSVHTLASGGRVVNVQSDFLDWIDTRIVVPLIPSGTAPPAAKHLNPIFDLDGESHVMVTQSMAAVPKAAMGPEIANLAAHQDDITRALDMVFQGF